MNEIFTQFKNGHYQSACPNMLCTTGKRGIPPSDGVTTFRTWQHDAMRSPTGGMEMEGGSMVYRFTSRNRSLGDFDTMKLYYSVSQAGSCSINVIGGDTLGMCLSDNCNLHTDNVSFKVSGNKITVRFMPDEGCIIKNADMLIYIASGVCSQPAGTAFMLLTPYEYRIYSRGVSDEYWLRVNSDVKNHRYCTNKMLYWQHTAVWQRTHQPDATQVL